MLDADTKEKLGERDPKQLLAEIEQRIAALPNITTATAMQLGRLIEQYAHARAGQVAGVFAQSLVDSIQTRVPAELLARLRTRASEMEGRPQS